MGLDMFGPPNISWEGLKRFQKPPYKGFGGFWSINARKQLPAFAHDSAFSTDLGPGHHKKLDQVSWRLFVWGQLGSLTQTFSADKGKTCHQSIFNLVIQSGDMSSNFHYLNPIDSKWSLHVHMLIVNERNWFEARFLALARYTIPVFWCLGWFCSFHACARWRPGLSRAASNELTLGTCVALAAVNNVGFFEVIGESLVLMMRNLGGGVSQKTSMVVEGLYSLDVFKVIFTSVPWLITIKPPFGKICLSFSKHLKQNQIIEGLYRGWFFSQVIWERIFPKRLFQNLVEWTKGNISWFMSLMGFCMGISDMPATWMSQEVSKWLVNGF